MTAKEADLKNQLLDLTSGEISSKETGSSSSDVAVQTILIKDASLEAAKMLVPEFGSDDEYALEGRVDVRRFTNINDIDSIWLNWFMNLPDKYGGGWARKYCDNYMNLRYSIGGEHKKLTIDLQRAIAGSEESEKKDEKKGFLSRFRRKKE